MGLPASLCKLDYLDINFQSLRFCSHTVALNIQNDLHVVNKLTLSCFPKLNYNQ